MIYVVRHGQTDWNLVHRVQGHRDIELNQAGIEQAKIVAVKLADVKFDVCFASPLKRALKTAQIIYHGQIKVDDRLIERGNGELEGRTNWREFGVDFDDPNETRFNIETLPQLQKRLTSFWQEILTKYPHQNVLVVSHAGTIMWSRVFFYGLPEDNDVYTKYHLNNCEIWQFDNKIQPQGY
ncbi:MAG: histidine phosphatase family protein [Clostridia bacterium]|nr:histidine phosphatase family protein [Clostridia bacterium]